LSLFYTVSEKAGGITRCPWGGVRCSTLLRHGDPRYDLRSNRLDAILPRLGRRRGGDYEGRRRQSRLSKKFPTRRIPPCVPWARKSNSRRFLLGVGCNASRFINLPVYLSISQPIGRQNASTTMRTSRNHIFRFPSAFNFARRDQMNDLFPFVRDLRPIARELAHFAFVCLKNEIQRPPRRNLSLTVSTPNYLPI